MTTVLRPRGAEPQPASGHASRRSTGTRRSTRSTPGSPPERTSSASSVAFFQSNHEGALIDRLHQRDFDVAIVNAGGLTHTASPCATRCSRSSGRSSRSTSRTRPSASRSGRSTSSTTSPSSRSSARAPAGITSPSNPSPAGTVAPVPERAPETAELRRLRRRIDALDRKLVTLLNERAELAGRSVARSRASAGERCGTPSANARCSCASRWRTPARWPRRTCSRSTAD